MKREASLRAQVLRAVIVVVTVLLFLIFLRLFGILPEQSDAPAPDQVEISTLEESSEYK